MDKKNTRPLTPGKKAQLSLEMPDDEIDLSDDLEGNSSRNGNSSPNTNQSSDVLRCLGEGVSESSISTSILDDEADVRVLKQKLEELEGKYNLLETKNERAETELTNEKAKVAKLEKKLQFVKDNQEVFMRLKEAYINMKYNEAAGRKMVEIREKSIQTWDGILCKCCVETEEVRRQIDCILDRYKELFVLSRCEMDQLVNTAKYLRDLTDRREKSWISNLERENKLKDNLGLVENENETLRKVLKERQNVVQEISVRNSEELDETVKTELTTMKKIIVKFEKRFRDMLESNGQIKATSPLNDKERKIVQQLMSKYRTRLQRKSCDRSRSLSLNSKYRVSRPVSPIRIKQKIEKQQQDDGASVAKRFPIEIDEKKTEHAIRMMDDLFA